MGKMTVHSRVGDIRNVGAYNVQFSLGWSMAWKRCRELAMWKFGRRARVKADIIRTKASDSTIKRNSREVEKKEITRDLAWQSWGRGKSWV